MIDKFAVVASDRNNRIVGIEWHVDLEPVIHTRQYATNKIERITRNYLDQSR